MVVQRIEFYFSFPHALSRLSAFVIKGRIGGRTLQLPDREDWDAAKLQRFCELNRDIRAELDAEGNVIVMSPSNLANGAELGWLIDPIQARLSMYRPGLPAYRLDRPADVGLVAELPGFQIDLSPMWD